MRCQVFSHITGLLCLPYQLIHDFIHWLDSDSAAIEHMVHSLKFLTTNTPIAHISVKLPNGDTIQVTHIEIVRLSSTFILEDILCIPTLTYNLVSISILTQNLRCCCIFLPIYCFIQDLQHWRTIGLGKKHGDLYTLLLISSAFTNLYFISSVKICLPFIC